MLAKTSAYLKRHDGQTKWIQFLLGGDNFFKNIILFEIKPVLTLRKNLIANLSIVKIFENKNEVSW